MVEQREKLKEEQKTLRKYRREAREAKKGVKKLKLSSCRPKSIKSRPNSVVASTSKDCVIRCPACEEEYYDPPTEEWIQCCKCQEWWYEKCLNYENGTVKKTCPLLRKNKRNAFCICKEDGFQ
ncbi:uncharacterized protein TNCV_4711871 [Trichonephila clavipes]|nr:uncharacterized protein TNCV_4711871 [Trichonephila clavipes]